MINDPAIILGFILSSLYGAVFHFWKGGNLFRLIYFLILAWLGFFAGQWIAVQIGWNFWKIGSLHLGFASLVSILLLFLGNWLSNVDKNRIGKE